MTESLIPRFMSDQASRLLVELRDEWNMPPDQAMEAIERAPNGAPNVIFGVWGSLSIEARLALVLMAEVTEDAYYSDSRFDE